LDTVSQEAIRLIETNSSKENEIKELQRQLESTNVIEKNRLETTINALKQQNIELTDRETSLSQQINNLVIEKDTLKNQLEEKQRLLAGISVGSNINEAIEQKDQEISRLKIQNEKLEQDIMNYVSGETPMWFVRG
jgi:chromosome segregation ATPase